MIGRLDTLVRRQIPDEPRNPLTKAVVGKQGPELSRSVGCCTFVELRLNKDLKILARLLWIIGEFEEVAALRVLQDKSIVCCFSLRTEPVFSPRSEPPLIMDFGSCWGQGRACLLLFPGCSGGACLEPEAVVSGFQDVTAVGQAVEQGRGHLGITKDCGPFAEAQVGGDDDARALV